MQNKIQIDNYTLIFSLDIQNLDEKIKEFIDSHKVKLEADLLHEKYIERKNSINIRECSKKYKISMKKVNEGMEKAEKKLYVHLLKMV